MFEWNNKKENFYFLYSFAMFDYTNKKEFYYKLKRTGLLFF